MIDLPGLEGQNARLQRIQKSSRRREPAPIAEVIRRTTPRDADWVDDHKPDRIPVRKRLSDLDTSWHPRVRIAVDAAKSWATRRRSHPNAALVLLSEALTDEDGNADIERTGYGCGKTHIAEACLWAEAFFDEDGTPVAPAGRFFSASRILANLSGGADVGAEIGGAKIIVIDEIGDEGFLPFIKQDAENQAFERQARYRALIDFCYKNGVSVVITSNLSAEGLAAHIGGRAWDRLMQMAPAGFIVNMTGVPSWRLKESGRIGREGEKKGEKKNERQRRQAGLGG